MRFTAKLISLFILIASVAACSATSSNPPTIQAHNDEIAVRGGSNLRTRPDQIFSTVLVFNYSYTTHEFGDHCSGVLISKDIVITAAHCITKSPTAIGYDPNILKFVYFGTQTNFDIIKQGAIGRRALEPKSLFRFANASGLAALPDWPGLNADGSKKSHEISNDLGLIKLNRPAPVGFQPAKLYTGGGHLALGEWVRLSGYGQSKEDRPRRELMLRAIVAPIRRFDHTTKLIVVGTTEASGLGVGDSGGPATLSVGSEERLFALTSSGVGRGPESSIEPILPHLAWLRKTTAALGGDAAF